MKLYFQTYGSENPAKNAVVILHGLFGSSTNWGAISKRLAEYYRVYALDLRNHGRSPHIDAMCYADMADDLLVFLDEEKLDLIYLLGHSMGGKAAMQFSLDYPDRIHKLLIVDIAPKAYPPHHEAVFLAIDRIDHEKIRSREHADILIQNIIPNTDIRLFLLTNLTRNTDGIYRWRANMTAIRKHYSEILKKPQPRFENTCFDKPSCFIRGTNSDYINDNDISDISTLFGQTELISIENAGHWVHAQQPAVFLDYVTRFFGRSA